MSQLEEDMVVEIPFNSNIKYEFDEKNNLRCDRMLHTSMMYPGNYGYFPHTLAGDGDPLDVLLISSYPLQPGCHIMVRVVGALVTRDEKGLDEKIIAVPGKKIDTMYDDIMELDDLGNNIKNKIKHFFEHYKDNEQGKWIKVDGWLPRQETYSVIEQSKNLYNQNS